MQNKINIFLIISFYFVIAQIFQSEGHQALKDISPTSKCEQAKTLGFFNQPGLCDKYAVNQITECCKNDNADCECILKSFKGKDGCAIRVRNILGC